MHGAGLPDRIYILGFIDIEGRAFKRLPTDQIIGVPERNGGRQARLGASLPIVGSEFVTAVAEGFIQSARRPAQIGYSQGCGIDGQRC